MRPFRGGGKGPWKKPSRGHPTVDAGPEKATKKKPRDPYGRNGPSSARRALFPPPREEEDVQEQQQQEQQEHRQQQKGHKRKHREGGPGEGLDVPAEVHQPTHPTHKTKGLKQKLQEQQQEQRKQQHQPKQLSHAVFVRNLPFDVEADSVTSVLQQFGNVTKTFLVKNDMGEGKGAAFVYFDKAVSVRVWVDAVPAADGVAWRRFFFCCCPLFFSFLLLCF